MKTKIYSIVLLSLLLLSGQAQSILSIERAGGLSLAAGTTNAVFDVDYINDTGANVTLLGVAILDFELNSSFYSGSGLSTPTLNNSVPDTSLTPFIDVGLFSPMTPLGTLAANNFVGFNIANGDSITLGTLDVGIPMDFLGEFTFTSIAGDLFAFLGPGGDPDPQGTSLDGTVTVGNPVSVPEPTSWLLLGIGLGLLGLGRQQK